MIVSRLPEEKNKSDYLECIRLKQKSDKFGNKRKKEKNVVSMGLTGNDKCSTLQGLWHRGHYTRVC